MAAIKQLAAGDAQRDRQGGRPLRSRREGRVPGAYPRRRHEARTDFVDDKDVNKFIYACLYLHDPSSSRWTGAR